MRATWSTFASLGCKKIELSRVFLENCEPTRHQQFALVRQIVSRARGQSAPEELGMAAQVITARLVRENEQPELARRFRVISESPKSSLWGTTLAADQLMRLLDSPEAWPEVTLMEERFGRALVISQY